MHNIKITAEKYLNIASKLITFNFLFFIVIIYLIVLYFLAMRNYDIGIDEAGQIMWAKNFATHGFPIWMWNQTDKTLFFNAPIDNVQMLPMYLLSFPFFKLDLLAGVWSIKLFSVIISCLSLTLICYVIKKQYEVHLSILFLFLLVIQPGFGFVSSSFFSEFIQAALFLFTIYFWLGKDIPIDKKKVLTIAMLFSLTMHTKYQSSIVILLSLLIFHFIDKEKRALQILIYTVIFYAIIAIIRFIPAFLYDHSFLYLQVRTYIFTLGLNGFTNPIEFYFYKINLFEKYIPLIIVVLTLGFYYFQKKNGFESFLYIYTVIVFFWWVFFFGYITYRHLMMGIVPFLLIFCIFIRNLYYKYEDLIKPGIKWKLILSAGIVMLSLYGFSTNIIYSIIGYNDGVQFDLDGSRSIYSGMDEGIKTDNSQKVFFNGIKKILKPEDTLYNCERVEYFYLKNPLTFNLPNDFSTSKYVIVGRDHYPLELKIGYSILDSLNTKRNLLYKYGNYELYSVYR